MKKRWVGIVTSAALMAAALAGCSAGAGSAGGQSTEAVSEDTGSVSITEAGEDAAAAETGEDAVDQAAAAGDTEESPAEDDAEADSNETSSEDSDASEETTDSSTESGAATWNVSADGLDYDGTLIRVGSLKGPTTMGLVNLMKASDDGEAYGQYTFDMESDPSAIVASVASGDLDIAMIPANLAASLYNKTDGGVKVIDINTLGVLYCVTADEEIHSVEDFAGKTVLTTGQGATPEYVLNYLLSENDITDCTLEFHSEATEIAALLKEDPEQIAVLPQPFVTVAEAQNDSLKTVFSLTDEWDKVTTNGSKLLTGATVVRTDYLSEHEDAVKVFEAEHAESAALSVDDPDGTAELVAEYGIIEKAPVARKALPECNIVCITGEEMKTSMEGYLQVLFDADPKAIGGALPGDDFYDLTAE